MDPETEKAIRDLNRYVTGPPKAGIALILAFAVGFTVLVLGLWILGWLHKNVGGIF